MSADESPLTQYVLKMKKYINPTTEVMHAQAMQALCQSVPQANNPIHAPERKEKAF
ncbi:MAG: hypothetical protein IJ920_05585 [Paludibacteraceae bacterium]|nr:hypothetical protein [Paludibacteraceae bacterium]